MTDVIAMRMLRRPHQMVLAMRERLMSMKQPNSSVWAKLQPTNVCACAGWPASVGRPAAVYREGLAVDERRGVSEKEDGAGCLKQPDAAEIDCAVP